MTDDIVAKELLLNNKVFFKSDLLKFRIKKIGDVEETKTLSPLSYQMSNRYRFYDIEAELDASWVDLESISPSKPYKCFFPHDLLYDKPQESCYVIDNYYLKLSSLWSAAIEEKWLEEINTTNIQLFGEEFSTTHNLSIKHTFILKELLSPLCNKSDILYTEDLIVFVITERK